jgi:hypothetical protein
MIGVRRPSTLLVSVATCVLLPACNSQPVAPSGPHTLTGVVTQMTEAGIVPVRGVFVEDSHTHRQAFTDVNGRYRLAAMPAGEATIQASMLRFEPSARSVTVTGDMTVDIQIVQRPQFTLSGFITEELPSGRVPLAGVLVEAVVCPPQPRNGNVRAEAETDADGFFSIRGMCEGETALFASKPGFDLPPAAGRACGGDGEVCHWVTVSRDTRFDLRMSRR